MTKPVTAVISSNSWTTKRRAKDLGMYSSSTKETDFKELYWRQRDALDLSTQLVPQWLAVALDTLAAP